MILLKPISANFSLLCYHVVVSSYNFKFVEVANVE